MALQALKKFIDGRGRRISVGDTLPTDYDKATLAHYQRHGMVGEPAKTKRSAAKPTETKPAGPAETKPADPAQPGPAAELPLA